MGAGATAPPRDPFDPEATRAFLEGGFFPVIDHYFRPRLLGAERLPERGPILLAPNHSGTSFPYDGMVLDALLWRRDGLDPAKKFRSVYEKQLSQHWWMRPFGIDDFWRRAGGVDLTIDNFERLLCRGDRVIYYPEGVAGIGKGFYRRYQLQRFSTSFVLLAARHGIPVYPMHIVNAEWVIPFNFTLPPLDWLIDKAFGVPFLPLPGAAIGIAFPFAWYLALPARMTFVVGDPLDVAALCRQEGATDLANPPRDVLRRVADRIRLTMQEDLDRQVEQYGARPYHVRSFGRSVLRALRRGKLGRVLPTHWPANFIRLDRDRRRGPARGALHRLARDWDLIGWYLPFGWPLLSLARWLRKPPCGYRGMSASAQRWIQGRFVWRLAERPLPPRSDDGRVEPTTPLPREGLPGG